MEHSIHEDEHIPTSKNTNFENADHPEELDHFSAGHTSDGDAPYVFFQNVRSAAKSAKNKLASIKVVNVDHMSNEVDRTKLKQMENRQSSRKSTKKINYDWYCISCVNISFAAIFIFAKPNDCFFGAYFILLSCCSFVFSICSVGIVRKYYDIGIGILRLVTHWSSNPKSQVSGSRMFSRRFISLYFIFCVMGATVAMLYKQAFENSEWDDTHIAFKVISMFFIVIILIILPTIDYKISYWFIYPITLTIISLLNGIIWKWNFISITAWLGFYIINLAISSGHTFLPFAEQTLSLAAACFLTMDIILLIKVVLF